MHILTIDPSTYGLHYGLQVDSSGEIEQKDLSLANGFDCQIGFGVNRGAKASPSSFTIEMDLVRHIESVDTQHQLNDICTTASPLRSAAGVYTSLLFIRG
jgi:hypothetical protein